MSETIFKAGDQVTIVPSIYEENFCCPFVYGDTIFILQENKFNGDYPLNLIRNGVILFSVNASGKFRTVDKLPIIEHYAKVHKTKSELKIAKTAVGKNIELKIDASLEKNPLDVQIGGNHYKDMAIQPIEFTLKNNLNFCQGNIIKYVCRYKSKNGIQDLEKAKHYIDLLIAHERKNTKD